MQDISRYMNVMKCIKRKNVQVIFYIVDEKTDNSNCYYDYVDNIDILITCRLMIG